MERENPNYYAIIPATVRYNKSLPPNAKLLYGEITALADKAGFCWATNGYFARLFDVSNQSVSSWISQLVKAGYIYIDNFETESGAIERRIYLQENHNPPIKNLEGGIEKTLSTPSKNFDTPHQKNLKQNNTSNITTINNTDNNVLFASETEEKPDEKIPYFLIVQYLNDKIGGSYRPETKATQRLIKARWNEGYRVEQFKTVIDKKVAEWRGTDFERYLCPDTLFGTKFEKYLKQNIPKSNTKQFIGDGKTAYKVGGIE